MEDLKAKLSDAKYLDEIMEKNSRESTRQLKEQLDRLKYNYETNLSNYHVYYTEAVKVGKQKEKEEQLKTKKMRTKKFYHTFDFKGREITLLLHVHEGSTGFFSTTSPTSTLKLTYSARLHEDEEVEGLTQKILLGRLEKGKLLGQFVTSTRFGFKLAYLKGLAFCFENEIKRGELEIVGVTSGVAKDKKAELEQAYQETLEALGQ